MDVRLPDGTVIKNVPDGTTKAQLAQKLQAGGYDVGKLGLNAAPKAPEQPQEEAPLLDRLGRQAGLTGRALIEGGAELVGTFSDPIAGVVNELGGNMSSAKDVGRYVADSLNLPEAENSRERIVQDASKLLVGTGGIIKGAQTAGNVTTGAANGVVNNVATRPDLQAAGAVGAGVLGGEARESGAGPVGQGVAAVVGGLVAPATLSAGQSVVKNTANTARNVINPQRAVEQVDDVIRNAGVKIEILPESVRQSIRDDVTKALQSGDAIDPDAIRRLADYRALNMTPMRSNLTLNPADVTREQNLVKLSANSSDPVAQRLANNRNANNSMLINRLNELGAANADDPLVAGNRLINTLTQYDEASRQPIDQLYAAARATSGRSATLDPSAFTNQANDALDNALLGAKLPTDVRNKLNSIAKGETPLTVDVAEQLKTNIAALQRSSRDGAEKMALGLVRDALENTPLLEGQGQEAINAFGQARSANRAYMQMVEATPALKAVRDGIEPDKFVSKYITGQTATVKDLQSLRKVVDSNPEAMETVRGQILSHLKGRGVNGAADEVAKISQSSYNKALRDIGDAKLGIFFSPEEIETLKQIGRVSSYEQFQPSGSAVNNSNTAAAGFTALLDRVANSSVLRKIPIGGFVANEAQNVQVAKEARNAMSAPKALTVQRPRQQNRLLPLSTLLIPGSVTPAEE